MLIEYIHHTAKNACRKPFKTLLTVCSIGIATTSIVLITTIANTGKVSLEAELANMGMNGITVGADEKVRTAKLGTKELEVIRNNDNVFEAAPVIVSYTEAKMHGLVADSLIWGIDETAKDVVNFSLQYGRMINGSDISAQRKVCVVDSNFSKAFYGRENIVGKKMRLLLFGRYEYFTVVGVVKSGGNILQGLMSGYIPSFVYIPYTTAAGTKNPDFDQIVVRVKNSDITEQTSLEIKKSLDNINNVTNGYRIQNIIQQKQSLNRIVDVFSLVLSCIAAISLLVSGLGIMTVMMMSVTERTREIGIKKSLGASKKVIASEFLFEACSISAIGGLLGISAGNLAAFAGTSFVNANFIHNIKTDVLFLLLAIFIGGIFGIYPAIKAADLNPIDALRYE